MGIDQAWDSGDAVRVDHDIRPVVESVADHPDDPVLDIDGVGIAQRLFQIARY